MQSASIKKGKRADLEHTGSEVRARVPFLRHSFEQIAAKGFAPDAFRRALRELMADQQLELNRLDCQLERLAESVLLRRDPNAIATLEGANEAFRQAWPRHARLRWAASS
jgi:hypothetical protein